ncbi:MAG: EFR1 family ferrodoxin [Spirochaetaceae bacterium]|nr:EFR1 family ferrodoxin [Spirochaetaceae bacterium]
MKTTIYYFTGTGNSLQIAEETGRMLGNTEIVAINKLSGTDHVSLSERIGFVFPLYYFGLPGIVERFIQNLDLDNSTYIFSLITCEFGNGKAIRQLDNIMSGKNRNMDSAFYIPMPNNYHSPPFMLPPMPRKQGEIINRAIKKLYKSIQIIQRGEQKKSHESWLFNTILLSERNHNLWKKKLPLIDKRYSFTEACTSCGICTKVCPVDNICFSENRPEWNGNCEMCMACLNLCPEKAIQYMGNNIKRGYLNPNIKLKALMN